MKALLNKLVTRVLDKPTMPVHVLCGIITVLATVWFGPWFAALGFICFLVIEIWTKKEWQESQDDFWEYVFGVFATLGILLAMSSKVFLVVALVLLLAWVILQIRRDIWTT